MNSRRDVSSVELFLDDFPVQHDVAQHLKKKKKKSHEYQLRAVYHSKQTLQAQLDKIFCSSKKSDNMKIKKLRHL